MKMKDAFPGKYLKAANFTEPRTLTISRVFMEDVSGSSGDPDEKPMVRFTEHPHGLVLNKTNFTTLVTLFGDDSDTWVGKQCILYATTTEFKGETVSCVRIRAAQEQTPAPQPEPPGPPIPARPPAREEDESRYASGDEDDIPF